MSLNLKEEKDTFGGEIKAKREKEKENESQEEDKSSEAQAKNYGIKGYFISGKKGKDDEEMEAYIKIKKKRTKSEEKELEEKESKDYNKRVIEEEKDKKYLNTSEKRFGFRRRFNTNEKDEKIIYKKNIKIEKEVTEKTEIKKPKRYFEK